VLIVKATCEEFGGKENMSRDLVMPFGKFADASFEASERTFPTSLKQILFLESNKKNWE